MIRVNGFSGSSDGTARKPRNWRKLKYGEDIADAQRRMSANLHPFAIHDLESFMESTIYRCLVATGASIEGELGNTCERPDCATREQALENS